MHDVLKHCDVAGLGHGLVLAVLFQLIALGVLIPPLAPKPFPRSLAGFAKAFNAPMAPLNGGFTTRFAQHLFPAPQLPLALA